MAGPSTSASPLQLAGSTPGLLDESQFHRLIRAPGVALSFAAFDPLVAVSNTGLSSQTHGNALPRPRRIVIETAESGQSKWRFVPSARLENGALDEGDWPRLITVCGRNVLCTQDQWDIYKLDPFYECTAYPHPDLSTVTPSSTPLPESISNPIGSKRNHKVAPVDDEDVSISARRPHKRRARTNDSTDSEDEVDKMMVDGDSFHRSQTGLGPTAQPRKRDELREKIDKNRQERRQKTKIRTVQLDPEPNFDFRDVARDNRSLPPEPKRKVADLFGSLSPDDIHENSREEDEEELRGFLYEADKHGKRTRTVSPDAARRKYLAQRQRRAHRKRKKLAEVKAQRGAQLRNCMFHVTIPEDDEDINMASASQVPLDDSSDDDSDSMPDSDDLPDARGSSPPDIDPEAGSEAERLAAIEESRRKLAELEADRPLWDEQRRRREEREKMELQEQARRKYERERQRQYEEWQRHEAERLRREEAEAEQRRREWEAKERGERERQAREQRWNTGIWSKHRAFERYKVLSETFDKVKHTLDEPVTFDTIPWPILRKPASASVEDITWSAVEDFFTQLQSTMDKQTYKRLVEQSHRRFHPDRWRSRNILASVVDESERACLEVAANTVAQALTPLWKSARLDK